jgi:hypothetical protein
MEFITKLRHPFSMIVAAPSQGGKTVFVSRLVQNASEMLTVPPEEIIWAYSEYQPLYNELVYLPNIKFVEGIPNLAELKENVHIPKLVILDDLLEETSKSSEVTALFTKGCHHWGISVIHMVQNLFFKSLRTARINASYLVLFKNPSDKSQINFLSRQLYPGSKVFIEAYLDATSIPYNYLLVDLTQATPDDIRLRTLIFPGENQIVYKPRK